MQKAFFCHGLASGILFRAAASGYDRRNEKISLTVQTQRRGLAWRQKSLTLVDRGSGGPREGVESYSRHGVSKIDRLSSANVR